MKPHGLRSLKESTPLISSLSDSTMELKREIPFNLLCRTWRLDRDTKGLGRKYWASAVVIPYDYSSGRRHLHIRNRRARTYRGGFNFAQWKQEGWQNSSLNFYPPWVYLSTNYVTDRHPRLLLRALEGTRTWHSARRTWVRVLGPMSFWQHVAPKS